MKNQSQREAVFLPRKEKKKIEGLRPDTGTKDEKKLNHLKAKK